MNTERSDAMVEDFRARTNGAKRRLAEFEKTFDTSPDKIFPLLCPTRERDWIPGWECELIYTESGYAEENCVIRTKDSSPLGSGIWVITRHEPNSRFELVRVTPNLVIQLEIKLIDNADGTTHTKWTALTTGITEQGNEIVKQMPDDDEKHGFLMACLEHYLRTGEMLEPALAR